VTWVRVAALAELSFAPGALVAFAGREFAVFPTPGGPTPYRALPDSCPHAGAALHDADLQGHVLACLWHGWRFDVRTGACLTDPADNLPSYPGRAVDGHLELDLP
jgi:nitrite reductase/ring-hydroxylating ferredoxin subunit